MGNEKFEEIVIEHSKKIYNYLLKILRHKEDAEDILQEVFYSFYQKWNSVNPDYYQSYLYKTAYHKALNFIKKKKKTDVQNSENLDYVQYDEHSYEDASEKVRTAMQKLSVKDATIIELKYFQKKNYQEISDIMSLSVKAVDSRLFRAKKRLRNIFLQDFPAKDV
jgi:RNA polymerase sigma-70 factor (ECF subfamily)